ncbi:glycoside hydrolase family 55 protein [Melanomma pulvis-pyrius CBS 109.77]|uniref:Glycoside hydrolase family 55 protein n=1 Tax=Melanomma pulvis-pyrius CBS 109.77 TaxID=1314802 RepID=A0A6A6X9U3_9PLEO|nr:glycoside hydrolase family 55 protein [Melanomma pulvis-pyrius CBS 109.77]
MMHRVKRQSTSFWMEEVFQNGESPFNTGSANYKVFRNVKTDYGAKGDGVTDDTEAINNAIKDGNRCGLQCGSSSVAGAVVYFPGGTYLVSSSIVQYYYTQFVGNPNDRAVIKAASSFVGLGVISSDVYTGVKNPDGSDGEWYINQSNFLRQIRNIVIDISNIPANMGPAGLHWQVGQATSLQNMEFIQNNSPGNNHVGIFMENGSGGFLSDLTFTGGSIGMQCGNQQFTSRNLHFNGCGNAIQMIWDWGWVWKSLDIQNCAVGMNVTGGNGIGSILVLDSSISASTAGIVVTRPADVQNTTQISLDNVHFGGAGLLDQNGATILGGGGTVSSWAMGKVYAGLDGSYVQYETGQLPESINKPAAIMSGPNVFEVSKPQYESVDSGRFVNVKDWGAKGDGSTDDTAALTQVLNEFVGFQIFFPFGVYMISDTLKVPVGSLIVGQAWSQIMAYGTKFQDASSPRVMVRVGLAGDVGSINIQDMLFTVRGPLAGAVLMEWNVKGSSPGAAAMWDSHFRVGGALGSDLQSDKCPTSAVNSDCIAAALLLHLTTSSSAYLENVWVWTSDHDLDVTAQTQVNVFAGRGMLIESKGPTWLYGTGSEHCTLYQYQAAGASDLFMAQIQTETPYYQPIPAAPAPFTSSLGTFASDPTFSDCSASNITTCAMAWAVRLVGSTNVIVYGAGLYNFFQNYDQACIGSENCQSRIFQTEDSGPVYVLNLVTKASYEMASPSIGTPIISDDNQLPSQFVAVVAAWLGLADVQGGQGGNDTAHLSPTTASILPLPCTTVPPSSTFTLSAACATDVCNLPANSGSQNVPPGPSDCNSCDLVRRLSGTCCGIGGDVINPILIPQGTELCFPMPIPKGYKPPEAFNDTNGKHHDKDDPIDDNGVFFPPLFPFPGPWPFPPPIPLPPDPPFGGIPPDLTCDEDGEDCCLGDVSDDIGLCPNGNFPVFDPFTWSINCDISDLTEALGLRTDCQVEADNDPEEAEDAVDAAKSCNWDNFDEHEASKSCSLTARSTDENDEPSLRLYKRSRPDIASTCVEKWLDAANFPTFPFASTNCDATYTCPGDDGHFPHVCANLAYALDGGKGPSYPLVPSSGQADHVTNEWYNTHFVENRNLDGQLLGAWKIEGCSVEEFPFASLRTGDQNPVLRLVEHEENRKAGTHWTSFRAAVGRYYKDPNNKPNKIHGAQSNPVVCFAVSGDTKAAAQNYGLDNAGTETNLCQQPYGVEHVLVPTDPWFTNPNSPGYNKRLTYTINGATTTGGPQYCNWPSPGRVVIDQSPAGSVKNVADPNYKALWFGKEQPDGSWALTESASWCAGFPYTTTLSADNAGTEQWYYKTNSFPTIGEATFPTPVPDGDWKQIDEIDKDRNDKLLPPTRRGLGPQSIKPSRTISRKHKRNFRRRSRGQLPPLAERIQGFQSTNYKLLKRDSVGNETAIRNLRRQGSLGSYLDIAFYSIFPGCDADGLDAGDCDLNPAGCPSGPIDPGTGGVYTGGSSSAGPTPTPTPTAPSISGYDYLGCWTDADQRTLPSNNEASNSMTVEACQNYCSTNGYDLFGTEDGNECWCSSSISTAGGATKVDESECIAACNGNTAEVCGGVWRVNIWQRSPPTIDPFQGYLGCYTDHDDPDRTLGSFFADSSDMTVEKCADICLNQHGYKGFGVEFGRQCYCGNSLNPATEKVDDSFCNMRCGGDGSHVCGAAWYISIYTTSGFGQTTPPQPTQGIYLWGIIDAIIGSGGVDADYWAITEFAVGDVYDDCQPVKGDWGELAQPDSGHFNDLPVSWALPSTIWGSLSSCTFTATATAASSNPTGTLLCPGLPTPVVCPPQNLRQGSCIDEGSGDILSTDVLVACEW